VGEERYIERQQERKSNGMASQLLEIWLMELRGEDLVSSASRERMTRQARLGV
jgi:hypothetical protein